MVHELRNGQRMHQFFKNDAISRQRWRNQKKSTSPVMLPNYSLAPREKERELYESLNYLFLKRGGAGKSVSGMENLTFSRKLKNLEKS